MPSVIDSDQHLYEYRGLWEEHIDPALRDDAIRFVEDSLGHVKVVWRDTALAVADVQLPGETDAIGERRRREREGKPPLARYDEILPRDYWEPGGTNLQSVPQNHRSLATLKSWPPLRPRERVSTLK